MEIGGDCQTTEGTESSHMHTRDDLNYQRGTRVEELRKSSEYNTTQKDTSGG